MLDAVARQNPLWIESACRVTLPPLLMEWSMASVHIGARSPSMKSHPSHAVWHPWQAASNGSPDCHAREYVQLRSEALRLRLKHEI